MWPAHFDNSLLCSSQHPFELQQGCRAARILIGVGQLSLPPNEANQGMQQNFKFCKTPQQHKQITRAMQCLFRNGRNIEHNIKLDSPILQSLQMIITNCETNYETCYMNYELDLNNLVFIIIIRFAIIKAMDILNLILCYD